MPSSVYRTLIPVTAPAELELDVTAIVNVCTSPNGYVPSHVASCTLTVMVEPAGLVNAGEEVLGSIYMPIVFDHSSFIGDASGISIGRVSLMVSVTS